MEFINKNKYTILLMFASAIVGFYLNVYSNRITNKELLDSLKAELALLTQAQQTARGSESEVLKNRKQELEAQINILSKK